MNKSGINKLVFFIKQGIIEPALYFQSSLKFKSYR